MEMTKIILRKNMRELRKERDWNQDILAEKTGYSTGFIADVERGKSWVSPEALEAISKAFNVSIDRLFLPDVGTQKTSNIVSVSDFTKRLSSIPDDVYELAMKVSDTGDKSWDMVRAALEVAIERREGAKSKKA